MSIPFTTVKRRSKTWSLVPAEIQNFPSLKIFKGKIKMWKPIGCTCRICTPFIPGVGFIQNYCSCMLSFSPGLCLFVCLLIVLSIFLARIKLAVM